MDLGEKKFYSFEEVLAYYKITYRPTGQQVKIACPFHKEVIPSMGVNLEKGLFHCFGCGVSGTIIDFVARMEGVDVQKASSFLSKKFQEVKREEFKVEELEKMFDEFSQKRAPALDELEAIYNTIVQFTTNHVPDYARNYWLARGIAKQTQEQWKLGVVQPGLSQILLKEHDIQTLDELGLVRMGKDVQVGRFTVPYFEYGSIVNVQTRATQEQTALGYAKYMPYIMKRKVRLYGVGAIEEKFVILTEGAIDALTLIQMGLPAIGVPGVETFTREWLPYLFKKQQIYVCYDMDAGGQKGVENLRKLFPQIHRIKLPQSKDVNEWFLKYGGGPDEFKRLMKQAEVIGGVNGIASI